jgi:hypothetical protein
MNLIPETAGTEAIKLCDRVIALLIGLVRRLSSRGAGSNTLPASPFPLPR